MMTMMRLVRRSVLLEHTRAASSRAPRGRYDKHRAPRPSATRDGEAIPQAKGELLYGMHSVTQALESQFRRIHALYVRDGVQTAVSGRSKRDASSDQAALDRIHAMAKEQDIEIKPISKWMLNHITEDKPHQGVVLDVDALKLPDFEPLAPTDLVVPNGAPVILALDELHDTQNLGAILRSAHFLGCSAVVLSERNSAPVSPAASRASAGALEVLVANNRLLRAKNLHQALAISRENGWRVVGACSGPNSITSNQLGTSQPTILVMGNEHRGLRKGIRQCCDEIVTIPGQATEEDTRVDSLNVSVAAAILLYELLHH
ncbi:hypothetical protein Poli38472_004580 [Pythium oligandrum]|uniref:rRNA methyltransferase 1, mitochondrial n=1 Tax=Pythium oligandrum TaxID=41045 RepID=A0A8K1CA63_PYTOL|nr:hypothetical protein Poli38472_004580 [Pythium oligandrum]|eukprot:TMW59511.1 hypothetical protein Poli38472_004580 [Pythium oligandrum]